MKHSQQHAAPATRPDSPSGASTCLVTGCAGFLGSHLTQALLGLGRHVVGVDNLFAGSPENMAGFRDDPRFTFLQRSVTEPDLWRDVREHCGQSGGIDAVFHLAAVITPGSAMSELDILEANHKATERLLAAAEEAGCARFVFAGSVAEYGAGRPQPVREEDADAAPAPQGFYGVAKYLATRAVSASPIGVSLRFFTVYGPRQSQASPYGGVLQKLVSQALRDAPLGVSGTDAVHDFLYVKDAVRACLHAGGMAGGCALPPGVYNVGTGKAVKDSALARLVQVLTNKADAADLWRDSDAGALPLDPAEGGRERIAAHAVADITAITERCSWRPEVVLSVGLARTIDWRRGLAETSLF